MSARIQVRICVFLVLMLGLAACGGAADTESAGAGNDATSAPADEAPTQAAEQPSDGDTTPTEDTPTEDTPTEAAPSEAAPSDESAGDGDSDPALDQAVELLSQAVRGQSVDYEGSSDLTIGILIPWFDGEGFQANYVGMAAEAIRNEVSMLTFDAQRSPEQGLAAVEDMISQGVDAIVMDPFDSAALSAAVAAANEADIPVVAFDQAPESGELAGLVASDNVEIGATAADLLVEAAEEQDVAVEDLRVIELLGDLASESGQDRHEGFATRAEEIGVEVVAELPTNWDDSQANAAVLDGLTAHPDANAIFMASGCAMYTGVQSALRSQDRLHPRGEDGHIILISVDGCPAPIDGIRDGFVDADSAQQLLVIGQRAMEIAVAAAKGEDAGETMERLGPDPTTPDNVEDSAHWSNVISVGAN